MKTIALVLCALAAAACSVEPATDGFDHKPGYQAPRPTSEPAYTCDEYLECFAEQPYEHPSACDLGWTANYEPAIEVWNDCKGHLGINSDNYDEDAFADCVAEMCE